MGDVPGIPPNEAIPGGIHKFSNCGYGGIIVHKGVTYVTILATDAEFVDEPCSQDYYPLLRVETRHLEGGISEGPVFKPAAPNIGNAKGISSPFIVDGNLCFVVHRERGKGSEGLFRYGKSELWAADGEQAVALKRPDFDASSSGAIAIHLGANGHLYAIVDGEVPGSYSIASTTIEGQWSITHTLAPGLGVVADVAVASDGTAYATTYVANEGQRLWRIGSDGALVGGAFLRPGSVDNSFANFGHAIALD